MKKLKWKLEVTIAVSEDWVADGFEATPARIKEMIEDSILDCATESEVTVEVKTITEPPVKVVRRLQGYVED